MTYEPITSSFVIYSMFKVFSQFIDQKERVDDSAESEFVVKGSWLACVLDAAS